MESIRSTISPSCYGTQRTSRRTRRWGCRGITVTHWRGWRHPLRRSRMNPSWPKRIVGGKAERGRIVHKWALAKAKSDHLFGQAQTDKMLRVRLYACVSTNDQQTGNAE